MLVTHSRDWQACTKRDQPVLTVPPFCRGRLLFFLHVFCALLLEVRGAFIDVIPAFLRTRRARPLRVSQRERSLYVTVTERVTMNRVRDAFLVIG